MDSAFERAKERIPSFLRALPGIRFNAIHNGEKSPASGVSARWDEPGGRNYGINDPTIIGYLAEGHNYGICCGFADLAVADIEDIARLEELGIAQRIPEAPAVKTGRKTGLGRHFYIICPDLEGKIILYDPVLKDQDDEPLHLGEIQSHGCQVVGPGSRHPSGNSYEVIKDLPIPTISKADLLKIFEGLIIEDTTEEPPEEIREPKKRNSGGSSLGDNVPIDAVAYPVNVKEHHGTEIQGSHPKHGSTTGKNFSINTHKNTWHCFRHKTGGDSLVWLAVDAGLIRCEDAQPGCMDDKELFKQVLQIAGDKGFYIPDMKPKSDGQERSTGPTVIDAIKALAGVYDGATPKDGMGFNKFDREEHEDIIERAISEGTLSSREEHAAYRFLKKYKKQLKGLGIAYEDIGHIARDDYGQNSIRDINDRIPEWIAEHHFKTVSDTERLYHYDHGVYLDDGERVLKALIEEEFGDITNNRIVTDIIGKVKRRTYVDRDAFNNRNILNIKNGLLDLEILQLLPHTPEYFSTAQIDVFYNPAAKAPKISKFLQEIAQSGDIALIEEIIGWLLWPDYHIHKAIMFLGPGRNGKGTLLRLITAFLGKKSISNVTLQDLVADRFAKADLYGKLANIGGDLPSKDLSDTATFRNLTGGDDNRAQEKYHPAFNFRNKAKLMFSANVLPRTPDDTYAFFSRWILIEFLNVFDPQKGTADPDLDAKLQTPEELSGLLNIALEGLKRLRKNGWKFSYFKTVEDVEIMYKRNANPVYAFLLDECEPGMDTDYIEKTLFNERFNDYARRHNLRPLSTTRFVELLKDQTLIPISTFRPWTGHDSRPMCWQGVKFKESVKKSEQKTDNGRSQSIPSRVKTTPSLRENVKAEEEKKSIGKIGYSQTLDGIDCGEKSCLKTAEITANKARLWDDIRLKLKKYSRVDGKRRGLAASDLNLSELSLIKADGWTLEAIEVSGIPIYWAPEKTLKAMGFEG